MPTASRRAGDRHRRRAQARRSEEARASDLELLRDSGLRATSCSGGSVGAADDADDAGDDDPNLRVEAMCRGIRGLAPIEPISFVFATGPLGDYEPERAHEIAVDGLRTVARAAADVGARIAIEPMHSSIAADYSWITNLPDAVALLDDIGEPNTGIMFDVWHLWDRPACSTRSAATPPLRRRPRRRLARPNAQLVRSRTAGRRDRDVTGILGALDEGGYDGWYELEVFSDDGRFGSEWEDSLWKLDPSSSFAWAARSSSGPGTIAATATPPDDSASRRAPDGVDVRGAEQVAVDRDRTGVKRLHGAEGEPARQRR